MPAKPKRKAPKWHTSVVTMDCGERTLTVCAEAGGKATWYAGSGGFVGSGVTLKSFAAAKRAALAAAKRRGWL